MKKIFLASILALSATAASAQGLYAGVQYSGTQLKEDGTALKADLNGFGVVGGYHINENVAVEGRYLTGVGSDTIQGAKVELDDYIGVNLIGSIPLGDGFSGYGSVGYGQASIKLSGGGASVRESDSSVSYGIGLQYKMTNYTIRGGYESLYDKDSLSAQGVTVTVARHF